jgi:hypothetical protein
VDHLVEVVEDAEDFPKLALRCRHRSAHSGMRLSEQYTIEFGQFDRNRRAIDLDKSKNGDARTVHLNADALRAIESVIRPK